MSDASTAKCKQPFQLLEIAQDRLETFIPLQRPRVVALVEPDRLVHLGRQVRQLRARFIHRRRCPSEHVLDRTVQHGRVVRLWRFTASTMIEVLREPVSALDASMLHFHIRPDNASTLDCLIAARALSFFIESKSNANRLVAKFFPSLNGAIRIAARHDAKGF
ncbi:unnamed protein product [Linum trigynum]|uniref:Uncharacterized protein n=1 Tax=Linum trigynum TaxID=586398 RepID=A0AAV2FSX3_9ROSI